MDPKIKKAVLKAQRSEITEYHVYSKLAEKIKDHNNKKILTHIAKDEMKHYQFWKSMTKQELKPRKWFVYLYLFLATIFGLSFTLKLMEKGEDFSQKNYEQLVSYYPKVKQIQKDEQRHEKNILSLLEEERISYASSLVLGLNDALVELTGALAGLTFALQKSNLIALSGIIMGFAASLSMAASGYLSAKEEGNETKKPLKSAFYTGSAYIMTVVLLILPYFIFENVFVSLGVMLLVALIIIFAYTFYITTAKSLKFWKRFLEMALISITVAVISFGIGYLLRTFVGVDL